MTFHPENVSQFESIFKKNEKAISEQPGCCHVELVIDLNHPLVRATVSRWDSEESLNAYRKSELFGKVWPSTKQLFSQAPEVVTYINLN